MTPAEPARRAGEGAEARGEPAGPAGPTDSASPANPTGSAGRPASASPAATGATAATVTSASPARPAAPTVPSGTANPAASRVVGIDVVRGLAVLGMFAVHVFDVFDSDGSPSVAWMVAAGRSAATFAVAAGIGLAFTTGRRRPAVDGPTVVSVAVRALLIGLVGLALGHVTAATPGLSDLDVVLPYYGMLFLLAIPLLGRRPRTLACAALLIAVLAPVLIRAVAESLPDPGFETDPTVVDAFRHPIGLLVELLVLGNYPVLAWLAYICAGLAIGRLDLASVRVAARLLVGGLVLAVGTWWVSSVVLFRLGGLHHLWRAEFPDTSWSDAHNEVLWDTLDGYSWWSLVSRAPHTTTPFDMLHTLGTAVALIGALLLLTRSRAVTRALAPLAAAGSMPLTFYTLHVLFLATGVLNGSPALRYAVMATAAVLFAVVWRRWRGRGPLEAVITSVAKRASRAVTPAPDRGKHESTRRRA